MAECDAIYNNQLAYAGATPWHGKGFGVEAGTTGEQMLDICDLNWPVQRRRIAMRDGLGLGKLLTDPLKNFRAIVRKDTDQVFQIATDSYFPMQNLDIVNYFKEFCEAGQATMETVGALYNGRIIWALAKLNGGSDVSLAGVDDLKGYMMLATSHDGRMPTIGQPTDVRVVCRNTFRMATSQKSAARFTMKHTRKWTDAVAQDAKKTMGMAIESLQETHQMAEKLTKISMNAQDRIDFVARLINGESVLEQAINNSTAAQLDPLMAAVEATEKRATTEDDLNRVGKAILAAIVDSPGSDLITAKNTAWGALNGVTYYVDHQRSRTQDLRLENAWFGSGDKLKSQAATTLLEMAGVN